MANTQPASATPSRDSIVDIADHPIVWRWMKETARRDPDGFARLVGPNEVRLHRLFGKPTWTADGQEGWTRGWAIHGNGLPWMVITGEGGTIFRVQTAISTEEFFADRRIGTGITAYLGELMQTLIGGF